ncbi:MAG: DUF4097 domain-containing protein [Agathobacter sp.]|nr:DUF4097 domain-containing protein [Agathobacter sp.]
MKRTIYLTILTVITIACILIGVAINVAGSGKWFHINKSYTTNAKAVSFTNELEAFDTLNVDLSAAKLIIRTGDGYSIGYEGADVLQPEYSLKNNVLDIKSPSTKISWKTNWDCTLTITVPEGTNLTESVIDIDAGNVECTGVSAEKLEIDVDAGNVELYDAVYGTADVDVDAGNVSFNDCKVSSITADSDMGNIELEHCAFDRLEANADMGNVTIHSSRDLSDYSVEMNADFGNISINGQDLTGSYRVNGDKEHYIRIEVSMGNAELFY